MFLIYVSAVFSSLYHGVASMVANFFALYFIVSAPAGFSSRLFAAPGLLIASPHHLPRLLVHVGGRAVAPLLLPGRTPTLPSWAAFKDEAMEPAARHLRRDILFIALASAGRKNALTDHIWWHCMDTILARRLLTEHVFDICLLFLYLCHEQQHDGQRIFSLVRACVSIPALLTPPRARFCS